MLKRNGEVCRHTVPDFVGRLTPAEFDAYNEAFAAIKDEFAALQKLNADLKELGANPAKFQAPDSHFADQSIQTQDSEQNSNLHWNICSRLLNLNHGDVLLGERVADAGKEYAVIERYQKEAPYARARGSAAVLLVGNDPLVAIQDYAASAQHTLRFMASNMVATAQSIVSDRFANQDPSRVIRAISERCARAAGEAQNAIQAQILERGQAHRKMNQHSMGRGV